MWTGTRARCAILKALRTAPLIMLGSTPAFARPGVAQTGTARTTSQTPPGLSSVQNRGHVTYSGGLLTVVADNGSLNQIVSEIAQQTGMKVSGRVADDRVFGTYGPASASAVLSSLLDGSGSNLLIVQDANHKPTELILTQRTGRPTPPDPNAQDADDDEARSLPAATPAVLPFPQGSQPIQNSRSPNRTGTGGVDINPAATSPSSTSQQLAFPPVDASTPPATATTTPTTPDPSGSSVKTPQQIFEQLQKLRQQQSQQPQ